jgi:soluble lytic murein transglycosylase
MLSSHFPHPPLARLRARRAAGRVPVRALPVTARAQVGDDSIVDAREALRKKDKARSGRAAQRGGRRTPSAGDVGRLLGPGLAPERGQQADLDAFYARWPGSYVEDRLRNDWLQELGRAATGPTSTREFPRFRMNDDREVTCYALLTQHLAGQDVGRGRRCGSRSASWTTAATCWPARCRGAQASVPPTSGARLRLSVEATGRAQARAAAACWGRRCPGASAAEAAGPPGAPPQAPRRPSPAAQRKELACWP